MSKEMSGMEGKRAGSGDGECQRGFPEQRSKHRNRNRAAAEAQLRETLRNSKCPGPAVGWAPAQCLSSTRSFKHRDESMSQKLPLYLFYIWKK